MIIKKGVIYHKRGDTAEFDLNVTLDGEPITNYEAVFSVKKTLKDTKYILQKEVVDGHVRLEHSDTQDLPFGEYYYDIQIKIDDGTEEGMYTTLGAYKYYLEADVTTRWEHDTDN